MAGKSTKPVAPEKGKASVTVPSPQSNTPAPPPTEGKENDLPVSPSTNPLKAVKKGEDIQPYETLTEFNKRTK